jgi:hypothetical protein
MTDLLDLSEQITLREKILRLSDLSSGISNGTIVDKTKAHQKRKQLMDQINVCPQLRDDLLFVFGSISQYDKSFKTKYPNYASSCTTISVLAAISILNNLLKFPSPPTSLDIDNYVIDGINKHKELVDAGSNPSAIVEDILKDEEIKLFITDPFEYNGSLLKEHGMWFDNMIKAVYDNYPYPLNDKVIAVLITASLETISLILPPNKETNEAIIFDPHARPELCNNSASLIYYISHSDLLNRLTVRFPEPEILDEMMVQFTATAFTLL